MYKLQRITNSIIQKVIRKNINPDENELEYWNRHWSSMIDNYKEKGIPSEIESLWWKNLYDEMIDYYLDVLEGLENKSICELGCGSGYASILMAKKNANITLVDFAPKSKEYAEYLYDYNNIERKKVNYILADAFSKNLDIGKYDVVWNCGVLEHYEWDKAVELIKIMMKHVKKGGHVMVTLPNLLSPELIYKMIIEGKGSEIYYTHKMLRDIMKEAGLQEVEVHPINYWVPSFLPHKWANNMRKRNYCKYIKSLAWLFNGIGVKE